MADSDTLAIGGDVEITAMELINYKGISADIRFLFTELEVYEDLYSASLSGSITIVDTHDLINVFPIIGEETLKVSFKTPGFPKDTEIAQVFSIYKLTNVIVPTPHKQIYTLHFTTPETMVDLNKRVSKAFQGTPDKMIDRLIRSDGLNTKKPVTYDQASNNIKFVSPFWTPFKCINYLTSRAQSVDSFKASNFLFFETNKQYKFKSINNIFHKNSEVKASYYYSNDPSRDPQGKGAGRDVAAEMMKIYTLTIDERFDMINRIDTGAYSHYVWDHNLLLKTINKRFYNYTEDFSKTNHLSDYPLSSGHLNYSKNTLLSTVTTYPQLHNGVTDDGYGGVITNRIPLLEQLNSFKMDITVNGRTDLEVGDLINLTVGGMEVLGKEDKYRVLDDTYNGRYLVVSIMHRVTIKRHQMIIQVIKESVNTKYD